jgi:arylformamidase
MPLDLEAEYNARAAVPEHPAINERWAKASAAYRARAHAGYNLPYGPSARQRCDLYHPPGGMTAGTPLVVYIHGGYWQRGERQMYGFLAEPLNSLGIALAVPSYDLCPAVSVAQIVDQLRACLAMLWQHTGRRPIVAGHSAGGHLTAAMLATDWSKLEGLPADLVRAGYAISGVFDPEPLIGTSINEPLKLDAAAARALNVMTATLPRKSVELIAAVGGAESSEFRRQSRDTAAAWARQGASTASVEVPGANHFTVVDELGKPGSAMVARIAALARIHG